MRRYLSRESSGGSFEAECEKEVQTIGTEHGWAGLNACRSEVEQLVAGKLRLQEEREHGSLGAPPEFFARQAEPLESALAGRRAVPTPDPDPVTSSIAAAAVVIPTLTAGVGASVRSPIGALLAVGTIAAATVTAALVVWPEARALAHRLWLHRRIGRLKRRALEAELRRVLADQWVAVRRAVLLPTYDLAYARSAQARRFEDAGRVSNHKGGHDVLPSH